MIPDSFWTNETFLICNILFLVGTLIVLMWASKKLRKRAGSVDVTPLNDLLRPRQVDSQVQRYAWVNGRESQHPTGAFVLFSEHEKVVAHQDEFRRKNVADVTRYWATIVNGLLDRVQTAETAAQGRKLPDAIGMAIGSGIVGFICWVVYMIGYPLVIVGLAALAVPVALFMYFLLLAAWGEIRRSKTP